MKTYRELMSEALQGDGDCYETAGKLILSMHRKSNLIDPSKAKLVHALVMGQGHLEGYRFGHGWVLQDGQVYDFSNGRDIVMDARAYYAIGGVQKKKGFYAEYTMEEAREKILSFEHWGPWDIDHSKEGNLFEARRVKDDEVMPDDVKEIGRVRKKVQKNIINRIKTP